MCRPFELSPHAHLAFVGIVLAGTLLTCATHAFPAEATDAAQPLNAVASVERRERACQFLQSVAFAGGSSPSEIDATLTRYCQLVDGLHKQGMIDGDARQRAAALHTALHQHFLLGPYQATASSITKPITGRPYNCTSATAIYLALAIEFDLDARAVSMPGHVWCRVYFGDAALDVETCSPGWSLNDAEQHAPCARLLDHQDFLALVYFNHGVQLHRQGRFAEAITANRRALELDAALQPAQANLLAAINNRSLVLAAAGRPDEGLSLLAEGLALQPRNEVLLANFRRISRIVEPHE